MKLSPRNFITASLCDVEIEVAPYGDEIVLESVTFSRKRNGDPITDSTLRSFGPSRVLEVVTNLAREQAS